MTKHSLIEELANEFAELKRTMFRAVSRQIDPSLPSAQGELLFLVARRHTLTVKEVAAEMRISSGAVTQLVDALVMVDLIKREQDEKDRRIVHILLSQKGSDQITQLRKDYLQSFEATMGTLSEAELLTLKATLKKLNGTIAEKKGK